MLFKNTINLGSQRTPQSKGPKSTDAFLINRNVYSVNLCHGFQIKIWYGIRGCRGYSVSPFQEERFHWCLHRLVGELLFVSTPCTTIVRAWFVLSLILFQTSIDRISRYQQEVKGSVRILSLNDNLQSGEVCSCEGSGMRISISKSEAMILCQKRVEHLLQVVNEFLPRVEFKYLRVSQEWVENTARDWQMD